jgi:hypothetical protein
MKELVVLSWGLAMFSTVTDKPMRVSRPIALDLMLGDYAPN